MGNDQENWKNLAQIKDDTPGGNWRTSRLFEDVGVAVEMGLTPSRFWRLPEQDQALVIAFYRAKGAMTSYEDHMANKKMKPAGGKS
jgi:hypothetical protein